MPQVSILRIPQYSVHFAKRPANASPSRGWRFSCDHTLRF